MARLSIAFGVGGAPRLLLAGAVCLTLLVLSASLARAATPQQDLADANASVQRALTEAREGDLVSARQAYDQYDQTWFDIEDGVRATSRGAYVAIEKAMTRVTNAFGATPPKATEVVNALEALDREQHAFIGAAAGGEVAQTSAAPGPQATTATPQTGGQPTIGSLLDTLAAARVALGQDDYAGARGQLKTFETNWVSVEGQVKTRSAGDYRQTETDMALAETLAAQRSPRAAEVVDRMTTRLEPYVQAQRYGIFDAAIILLREGLEALLVIVALSAFLKKSGNAAGQAWLWSGAVGGLLLSVLLGVSIQAFFGAIINPGNREIMEGSIGLVAAAMLIYVSYWLHSKANLGGWQSYISARTSQAIEGGRLLGLAALAFLAVFREGAETALFYLGMASNISNADLFVGLALGFAGLGLLGFLMVVVGVRIPLRPFFSVASLLVFYLCFKFIGMGIHALQVGGVLPNASAGFLPSLDVIGLYPTWPTTIAQLVLLAAAGWVLLHDRVASGLRPRTRVLVGSSR